MFDGSVFSEPSKKRGLTKKYRCVRITNADTDD